MTLHRLEDAHDEARFGGKAAGLAAALRAGFHVPQGVVLAVDTVERIVAGDPAARELCRAALQAVGGRVVAARSSAVGEDATRASFAGQHLTRLDVTSAEALREAVLAIHASARTGAALAYRARVGVTGPPRVAVVVQRLVEADCAGVLFTRDPVSAADERVIEASWGLGEAVVSGRVDPDRWRMRRGGQILSRTIGEKDVELRLGPRGGLEEVLVDTSRRAVPCLSERNLLQLEAVAARCEAHFPGAHDVEWALWGDELFLLQRRAVTR